MQIAVETQKDGSFLTSLHIAFLSALIALPIFSGFDIFSASRFGVFLLINVICGQYIWSRLVQERKPEVFESLAAGLAIGTSLPALINIGIRLLDLRGFHTAYIFPTLCILFWSFFDRKRPILSARPASEDDRDFRFIIATPFLAVVAWNPQAWPFCATYLLGIYFFYQKRIGKRITTIPSTRLFATPTILLISLIVNMVYRSLFRDKPLWRNFLGADTAWDESAAWSVSQFGIKQNAMFANQPFKGHILTHSWAGDLAAATFSPEFLVTGIPGFAIGALGVALIVYAMSISLFAKRTIAISSLLILFLQASLPEEILVSPAPRFANSLSVFYLVCAWHLLLNANKWKTSFFHMILFVLTVIVTLSKIHWGVILVFSATIISFESIRRTKVIGDALFSATAAIAFFATYFAFVRGTGNAEEFNFSVNYYLLLSILIFVVTRIIYSVSRVSLDDIEIRVKTLFFSNLFFMVILIWLTNGENNTFYSYHSMIILSAIVITPNIVSKIKNLNSRIIDIYVFFVIGVSSGIGSSLVYLYLRYRLSNNGKYPLLYWMFIGNPILIQPLILLTAVTTLGSCFFLLTRKKSNMKFYILIPIVFMLVLGSNLGTWLVHPFKPSITNIWQDVSFNSELVFSNQQISVGKWIQINTPVDSLVASNFQCSPFELGSTEITNNLECSTRNTLSWIVPLARRTALLESVVWFQGIPGSRERLVAEHYLDVVDLFARLNNPGSLSVLRDLGVDYVVIDKFKTALANWGPSTDVVFENKNYFVLKMVKE